MPAGAVLMVVAENQYNICTVCCQLHSGKPIRRKPALRALVRREPAGWVYGSIRKANNISLEDFVGSSQTSKWLSAPEERTL